MIEDIPKELYCPEEESYSKTYALRKRYMSHLGYHQPNTLCNKLVFRSGWDPQHWVYVSPAILKYIEKAGIKEIHILRTRTWQSNAPQYWYNTFEAEYVLQAFSRFLAQQPHGKIKNIFRKFAQSKEGEELREVLSGSESCTSLDSIMENS